MTGTSPENDASGPDGSELAAVDAAIEHARDLEQQPTVDETSAAGPFFDAEPAFVDTGEASDIDDQTIAPPG